MTPALTAAARAADKAASALKARDEAIRKAHADGATLRAIAEIVGLTHARIHQIVHAHQSQ